RRQADQSQVGARDEDQASREQLAHRAAPLLIAPAPRRTAARRLEISKAVFLLLVAGHRRRLVWIPRAQEICELPGLRRAAASAHPAVDAVDQVDQAIEE